MSSLSISQAESLMALAAAWDEVEPRLADLELLDAVASGEPVEDWDRFRAALKAAVEELTAEEVANA